MVEGALTANAQTLPKAAEPKVFWRRPVAVLICLRSFLPVLINFAFESSDVVPFWQFY